MSLQQYLKVVICFIILTDLTKFLLKFCVDEVFEDRGAINMRRIKRGKSSSLGMPKAPQVNTSRILKHLSLGMPKLASRLSSSTIIGIPWFLFCSHNMRLLCLFFFSFPLWTMLVWDSPSLIYRMLHVLHLIFFQYGFIECSLCFT